MRYKQKKHSPLALQINQFNNFVANLVKQIKLDQRSSVKMEKGILGAKTIKQASRLMKANVFTCPELIE